MSFKDGLLIRAAVKVVPLELAMSRIFWFVFPGWSFLSVSHECYTFSEIYAS